MSKIHKITKQKVKKISLDSNCLFLKEIHPSEPITFWSFMEIMLDHQERSLANICCWSALLFKQRNTWWSNSSEWADISFGGNGKEIQYESVCNPWGNRDIWLVFLSLPPRYQRCHILRLAFDLKIWNQAVPKQKSYFVKKMLRDHADILIIPAWIKPVENALKSGVNRSVSHWVLL